MRTNYSLTNFAYIDLDNQHSDLHKLIYFGTEDASTLTNSPVTSGPFYGYRIVRWNTNLITVELHEQYPNMRRIWINTYDKNTSKWNGWSEQFYAKDTTDAIFTAIDGNVYSEYTCDGYLRRLNKTIIINMNISPGFCNAGQWWSIATLADGAKPEKNLYCNAQGYQGGWSDPTAVACMIQTNGIIYIYSQNTKLTNFTISASWFTNQ